ncbi:MAG: heme NO-binding domain-containing protein [Pseudoruegeria sp.]
MHGLINCSLQLYLTDRHGAALWKEIASEAEVPDNRFEPMLPYEDAITTNIVAIASRRLQRNEADLLEDLGTYLITSSRTEVVRRLLRYGGVSFREFLYSLDELEGRVKLAVPDLEMPRLELRTDGEQEFQLVCTGVQVGMCYVLVGILRALADDYGALVLLDSSHSKEGNATITVQLLNADHTRGRRFSLAQGVVS